MKKKLVGTFITMILTMSMFFNSFAMGNIKEVEQVLSKEEIFYVNGEAIHIQLDPSKLADAELETVRQYMNSNNMYDVKDLLNVPEDIPQTKNVKQPIPIRIPLRAIADGSYSDESWKDKTVDFGKHGGNILYYEVLGIEVYVQGGKITRVSKTSFTTESMPFYGSISNIRIPTYVAASGLNAGMTVNYDITKTIDIPIVGEITLPGTYSKNEVASLIYYIN